LKNAPSELGVAPDQITPGDSGLPPRRRRRRSKPKRIEGSADSPTPKSDVASGDNLDKNASGDEGARPRRTRRRRRSTQPRIPSKTNLFVANLPYALTDERLKELFKDFAVQNAYVVRRPNLSSLGYGFVELNSEEEQQRALLALDKTMVDERELSIKVALTAPVVVEGESENKTPESNN